MEDRTVTTPADARNAALNESGERTVIELRNINKKFGDEVVLNNLNLKIKDKEFITFLGPSGCGKTTMLRIIAGFLEADSGQVIFEGKDISDLPPHKRQVNTIFQRYQLFPHLNVYENVAFGLRNRRMKEKDISQKVEEMLDLVNLRGFQRRDIASLSGGQQQRVAIARALAVDPQVLLLDEPLAALDLKLRKDMQVELKNIQKRLGITFVFVTHDQQEALSMSDTVVVMNEGEIQQIGTPQDIYNEPKNAFVADFIGESNILDGVMLDDFKAKFSGAVFQCLDKGFAVNESVDIVIRPEDVDVVPVEQGEITGVITSNTFKGIHFEMIVDIQNFKWMIQTTDYYPVGSTIGIEIEPDAIHVMKKSKYSGMFGDYSTFSDEMEHLSDITEEEDA
ncbi:MAG: ABC transporter ATP-binding protein [Clostridia bacterium]|nr:ABC transporter ATP-binding protein [Clostridia bacterium]